jgi:enoyl-CoA hydratase
MTGKQGDALTITLVTEGGVNVLSSSVLGELGEAIKPIPENPSIRFVIIRGEGRAFVAGADIQEMSSFAEDDGLALSKHGNSVFNLLESLPKVTLALVNGHALGGGCELAMACDFRISTVSAKWGMPEARLGLIPGWGGTVRLQRLVGPTIAKRMMFTGDTISADEAKQIGLVDELVPTAEDLDAAAGRWMKQLSATSPNAVARIKRALLESEELEQFSLCFCCADSKEGMNAFLEKRPPNWAP